MGSLETPSLELAKRTLPAPLWKALCHIFEQGLRGVTLVGGTALSGFYAAHRRSDDLDFFASDKDGFRACVLAVKSLERIGAKLSSSYQSEQYYRVLCELEDHLFTIDVVEDENFFKVCSSEKLDSNIEVADLKSLLMTKAATLVSRCSEKDLYDLLWLAQRFDVGCGELIELGRKIDAGVTGEAMMISIGGAVLREEACDFALPKGIRKKEIYTKLVAFQKMLIKQLRSHLQSEPAVPLKKLLQELKKLK